MINLIKQKFKTYFCPAQINTFFNFTSLNKQGQLIHMNEESQIPSNISILKMELILKIGN